MHPRCAELIRFNSQVVHPELHMDESRNCVWCGNIRPEEASPVDFHCWSYQLTGGQNRIHVHCYSEMITEALNSIADSPDYNHYEDGHDNTIRIVLRRRSTDGTGWEGILEEAFDIALEVAGLGLTQLLIDLI
ncbi:hypothetical protein CDL15_Pgr002277 [Punica granatum]|uniref:Uncharacterized protein n=1 Tax=Punica granatum TaxID=22663 RepID=A0A218WIG0_PUNGR|nr:hypothetical protein CDL15_Pgr002277 [Punica granatum]